MKGRREHNQMKLINEVEVLKNQKIFLQFFLIESPLYLNTAFLSVFSGVVMAPVPESVRGSSSSLRSSSRGLGAPGGSAGGLFCPPLHIRCRRMAERR